MLLLRRVRIVPCRGIIVRRGCERAQIPRLLTLLLVTMKFLHGHCTCRIQPSVVPKSPFTANPVDKQPFRYAVEGVGKLVSVWWADKGTGVVVGAVLLCFYRRFCGRFRVNERTGWFVNVPSGTSDEVGASSTQPRCPRSIYSGRPNRATTALYRGSERMGSEEGEPRHSTLQFPGRIRALLQVLECPVRSPVTERAKPPKSICPA